MNFKGVLLDFGYTLAYLNEEAVRRYREGLVSILRKHGWSKRLEDLVPVLDDIYESSTRGEVRDVCELLKILVERLELSGKPTLVQELSELRRHHLTTRLELYDKARLVLSTLKEKYRLALVSNCFAGLLDYLKALRLTSFFDCIVLSYEVGVKKPDRRIYLEALHGLRLRPEECVFVSDAIRDLEGAREVGLKTFLVRQGKHTTFEAKNPNFKPDLALRHISEIIEHL